MVRRLSPKQEALGSIPRRLVECRLTGRPVGFEPTSLGSNPSALTVKSLLVALLLATLVAPAASQLSVDVDSTANVVLKKYWTAHPDAKIACLYGDVVDSTTIRVDSVTVVDRCFLPAIGGLGFVRSPLDSVDAQAAVASFCTVLQTHPGWHLVGVIEGIEDVTRRLKIIACWRL